MNKRTEEATKAAHDKVYKAAVESDNEALSALGIIVKALAGLDGPERRQRVIRAAAAFHGHEWREY